jgi:arylformamidase
MKLFLNQEQYIETSEGIDISIPLTTNPDGLKAWYVSTPQMIPVAENGFIGEVAKGGSVNFRSISFNPHGHVTHTECLGHITEEVYSVNQTIRDHMCTAYVVTVDPTIIRNDQDGKLDRVIRLEQLKDSLHGIEALDALIIRTFPNNATEKIKDYSNTNPAYIDVQCIGLLNSLGVLHVLIDTPSVDRENDQGELLFHHAFWDVPKNPRFDRTITEMILVADEVADGKYILNLQVAPFENDASPARPVLYKIKKRD